MRHGIVLGRKFGESSLTVIVQPTDPRSASDQFKKLLTKPGELEHIELWESNVKKKKTFRANSAQSSETAKPETLAANEPPVASEPAGDDEEGPPLGAPAPTGRRRN